MAARFRSCIAATVVRPRARIRSSSSSDAETSRWLVGSSSSTTQGRCANARASWVFCFSPPDRLCHRRCRRGGDPGHRQALGDDVGRPGGGRPGPPAAVRNHAEFDDLFDGQLQFGRRMLLHEGDRAGELAAVDLGCGFVADHHTPGVGAGEAGHRGQQRRLAGAVRPDEPGDPSGGRVAADAVEDRGAVHRPRHGLGPDLGEWGLMRGPLGVAATGRTPAHRRPR